MRANLAINAQDRQIANIIAAQGADDSPEADVDAIAYLQLRIRHLQKLADARKGRVREYMQTHNLEDLETTLGHIATLAQVTTGRMDTTEARKVLHPSIFDALYVETISGRLTIK